MTKQEVFFDVLEMLSVAKARFCTDKYPNEVERRYGRKHVESLVHIQNQLHQLGWHMSKDELPNIEV